MKPIIDILVLIAFCILFAYLLIRVIRYMRKQWRNREVEEWQRRRASVNPEFFEKDK